MTVTRTVLGDVATASLGVVDAHDHLFFGSAALPGQELDDADHALREASAYAAAGGNTVVQWTPRGLGRRRAALAEISRRTGVHIVSATGRHRAEHYHAEHSRTDVPAGAEPLAAGFVADIEAPLTPCGLIKIGTGYHHLDAHERVSLTAAAAAHHATGVPVAIHLELGTGGDLVVQHLTDAGVAPGSIVLGHVGRNPDGAALRELAGTGAFLCFDGPSRANHRTDWRTPECIEALLSDGHLGQILLGGDTTTSAARSTIAGPGLPGLLDRFGAALRRRLGADAMQAIWIDNPARALALGNERYSR